MTIQIKKMYLKSWRSHMQSSLKFLIFGKIPPPIGGVTISIQNLRTALKSKGFFSELISKSNLLEFKKFDIGHIHYSKQWKVLAGILLSKLLCKKTIVTKHGAGFYPKKLLLDRLILSWSDGMILLNQEVYERCLHKKQIIKLAPIFKEGVIEKNSDSTPSYFKKNDNFKYILLYAVGKTYINNQEVYGVHFILNLLSKLDKNIQLIFLDPSGEYQEDIAKYTLPNIIYLNNYVDFNALVRQVNLYIRPTTSDGNSVATLESLANGTAVLASDIVERNEHVVTYKTYDQEDFIRKLNQLMKHEPKDHTFTLHSIDDYIDFCNTILNNK